MSPEDRDSATSLRYSVMEMEVIEKRQEEARVNIGVTGLCTHERFSYLDCDDCRDDGVECNARLCRDCEEVFEE